MQLPHDLRSVLSVLLTAIALTFGFECREPLLGAQAGASAPDEVGLHIVVLSGEDGVNIIKKKSAVRPVVEVRDRNNLPVSGASVVFMAPNSGASAAFLNGSKTLTVLTNSAGRATVAGIKPVGVGTFKIDVAASFHGQTASAAVSQTNYATVATAHAAGAGAGAGTAGISTGAVAGIVGGVAAAAAVGAVVSVKLGGGGKSGTIGLGGTPTFGATR